MYKRQGIAKFVGGYVAAMNGVDAIVFTAGIGENVGQLRKDVCNYFGYLGVEIDDKANDTFSEEIVISTPNSKVKVAVIPTNEELAICRDTVCLLYTSLCERIGIDGRLVYQKAGLDKEITECAMPTHKEAIQFVLDALTNEKTGAIKSLKEVDAIGHRVVHGGEKFASSAVITDEMIAAVKECNDLAPLHNPANLIGIDVCSELMPGVPQVGVFDTAFHQTMPAKAYLYLSLIHI